MNASPPPPPTGRPALAPHVAALPRGARVAAWRDAGQKRFPRGTIGAAEEKGRFVRALAALRAAGGPDV